MIEYATQTPSGKREIRFTAATFWGCYSLRFDNRKSERDTQTLIKLDSPLESVDDYVFPRWFLLFSRPHWSLGKSPGACPPEEATISVWMRGYRTVVWKRRRVWLMESPRFAVISLWFSSHQIYRLLISASPTLMDPQARSFELSAIYTFSFHDRNCTYTTRGVKFKSHHLFILFSGFQRLLCNIWDKSGKSV